MAPFCISDFSLGIFMPSRTNLFQILGGMRGVFFGLKLRSCARLSRVCGAWFVFIFGAYRLRGGLEKTQVLS